MANIAASIVIKKIGTAVANKQEIQKMDEVKNQQKNKKFYSSKIEILNKCY